MWAQFLLMISENSSVPGELLNEISFWTTYSPVQRRSQNTQTSFLLPSVLLNFGTLFLGQPISFAVAFPPARLSKEPIRDGVSNSDGGMPGDQYKCHKSFDTGSNREWNNFFPIETKVPSASLTDLYNVGDILLRTVIFDRMTCIKLTLKSVKPHESQKWFWALSVAGRVRAGGQLVLAGPARATARLTNISTI